ncbi:secretory lipase [Purpureocillium lavendulum]|uniref:Secretory lipase n=1 Tax=Purpureocillium lavendulum TaxID=1247861 RepID=A0AB34G280_9HYPO|nr:secretory lipase [Purpureocillium lavendulum]
MVLESLPCRSSLHKLGQNTIRDLSAAAALPIQFQSAKTADEEPIIPSPSVFDFAGDASCVEHERGDAHRLPIVASCAAHLELLEVFYLLRQKVLASEDIDRAFDIKPKREHKTGANGDTKTLRDPTLWTRRQCKWTTYLEFAAVRFLVWRDALRRQPSSMALEHDGSYKLTHLPPLDVLMVWHAFMLNPRLFNETCKDEILYKMRMPWKAVHDRIDNRNWTFELAATEKQQFERTIGLSGDLFAQFTTWIPNAEPKKTALALGFFAKRPVTKPAELPVVDRPRLNDFSLKCKAVMSSTSGWTAVDKKYKDVFETTNCDLAIKLRDAVDRQTAFVDKMNNHMWIRSPALAGTITRAIGRYGKFLDIMRRYPKIMVVPTLDIDLVWHTHQCAAVFYARGMKAIVGRFINHDDSIVEATLNTGFDDTMKLWQVHYGTQYRTCGCWDCEALQSALDDAAKASVENVDMAGLARRAQKEVTYYRAVEVAIRKRKPLPVRTTVEVET